MGILIPLLIIHQWTAEWRNCPLWLCTHENQLTQSLVHKCESIFHQSGMNSGGYLLNGKVETYLSTTFRNTKLDYWIIYIYYTKKQKISALLLVNEKNSWKWISGSTISSLHLKGGRWIALGGLPNHFCGSKSGLSIHPCGNKS